MAASKILKRSLKLLLDTDSAHAQSELEEIADAINALCKRTGLSQADIARQLGVPRKTLNDWLPNKNRPPRTKCRHAQMLALAIEALEMRLK